MPKNIQGLKLYLDNDDFIDYTPLDILWTLDFSLWVLIFIWICYGNMELENCLARLKKETEMNLFAMILFVIGLAILGPCMTIWSLNTLFHLGLEINFNTWLAALWLFGAMASAKFSTKKE